MVNIEKSHLDIFDKLTDQINSSAKKFTQNSYKVDLNGYEQALDRSDLSAVEKKELVSNKLTELTVKTFSIDISKISSKSKIITTLKSNIGVLRKLVTMLRDINHYLEDSLLEDLDLTKPISFETLKIKDIKKILKKDASHFGKEDVEKLELTVYKLFSKIIFLDQRLLKKYQRREEKIIKTSSLKAKDLNKILKKESELLSHLEAKLPPPSKINNKLLEKSTFSEWVSRILALIISFKSEHKKEELIFQKLKKNKRIKKKVDIKINHLLKEKWELLKLKESRVLSTENVKGIDSEHHRISRHYASVSKL
jgi:hypothetical protein